jgi:RNA recognition motif-containing protein
MDGYRLDADSPHGLSVQISDPAKKNKRSDETYPSVFVGGLDAKTTEQDVRDLFGVSFRACPSLIIRICR